MEREYIHRMIAFTDGNKVRASEMLRVPRRTLYNKLERHAKHGTKAVSMGTDIAVPAMACHD
ncbi:MAG: helix-turn-helix domain-containing protein [Candidatus Binataceae bacterium]